MPSLRVLEMSGSLRSYSGLALCSAGLSIIELVVTLAIAGIVMGTAISNLKELDDPLSNASFSLAHYFRLARSRAISQTLAIQLTPSGSTRIIAKSSNSCSGTMTPVSNLNYDFPSGSRMLSTDWTICFSSRGFAASHVEFDIIGDSTQTKTAEVALGGGARVE